METRPSDFHPEIREGSRANLVSNHKSARHDWQAVWQDPTHQDPKRSKRARVPPQWATGCGPKYSTALQLARLAERVPSNLEEKRLTATVFPDVAKAFDTVCFDGLLHKLTVLNFLSYLVKTISSCLHGRMFAVSSKHPHLLVLACGLAWIRVE
jgi:hypothetical protein